MKIVFSKNLFCSSNTANKSLCVSVLKGQKITLHISFTRHYPPWQNLEPAQQLNSFMRAGNTLYLSHDTYFLYCSPPFELFSGCVSVCVIMWLIFFIFHLLGRGQDEDKKETPVIKFLLFQLIQESNQYINILLPEWNHFNKQNQTKKIKTKKKEKKEFQTIFFPWHLLSTRQWEESPCHCG